MYRILPRTLRHRGNAYGLSMAALGRERWQAKTPYLQKWLVFGDPPSKVRFGKDIVAMRFELRYPLGQ